MGDKDEAQSLLKEWAKSVPIGVYEHYKGGLYTLFAHSVKEDTGAPLIHYFSHQKKTRWTRDYMDFTAHVQLESGTVKRFVFLRKATPEELTDTMIIR